MAKSLLHPTPKSRTVRSATPATTKPPAPKRAAKELAPTYKVIGRTFDGIEVLEPKTKATHFKRGEARQLFKRLLGTDGIANIVRNSQAASKA